MGMKHCLKEEMDMKQVLHELFTIHQKYFSLNMLEVLGLVLMTLLLSVILWSSKQLRILHVLCAWDGVIFINMELWFGCRYAVLK